MIHFPATQQRRAVGIDRRTVQIHKTVVAHDSVVADTTKFAAGSECNCIRFAAQAAEGQAAHRHAVGIDTHGLMTAAAAATDRCNDRFIAAARSSVASDARKVALQGHGLTDDHVLRKRISRARFEIDRAARHHRGDGNIDRAAAYSAWPLAAGGILRAIGRCRCAIEIGAAGTHEHFVDRRHAAGVTHARCIARQHQRMRCGIESIARANRQMHTGTGLLLHVFEIDRTNADIAERHILDEEITDRTGVIRRIGRQYAGIDMADTTAINGCRAGGAAGDIAEQITGRRAHARERAGVDFVAAERDGLCVLHRRNNDAVPLAGLRAIGLGVDGITGNRVGRRAGIKQVMEDAAARCGDDVAADARCKTGAGCREIIVVGLHTGAYGIHQVAGDLCVEIVLDQNADAPGGRRIDIDEAIVRYDIVIGQQYIVVATVDASVDRIAHHVILQRDVIAVGEDSAGNIGVGAVEIGRCAARIE